METMRLKKKHMYIGTLPSMGYFNQEHSILFMKELGRRMQMVFPAFHYSWIFESS